MWVFLFDQLRDILAPSQPSNACLPDHQFWNTKGGFIKVIKKYGPGSPKVHGVCIDIPFEQLEAASQQLYGDYYYDSSNCLVDCAMLDGERVRAILPLNRSSWSAPIDITDYAELGITYNQSINEASI